VDGAGEPRIWSSPDGREWDDVTPDFGPDPLVLVGILRLSVPGVIVVGNASAPSGETGVPLARAFGSQDGRTWTEIDLPTEIAEQGGATVGSGPIGHLIGAGAELWYSPDAESWFPVLSVEENEVLSTPVGGDEGFVIPVTTVDGGTVHASGDGRAWTEGSAPLPLYGVAPWRGDWFAWSFRQDPPGMVLLRSADGLAWDVAADVNDLTGPDGPKAGRDQETDITEAWLSGEGGVVMLTLGWNHCCATPPQGIATLVTTDGEAWLPSGLPSDAYVTSIATDGTIVVAVGHLDRGASVGFWVAER
jgi:hypothetical protein